MVVAAAVIVPPVAIQVTAVLAVNCCVCPGCSVALVGRTVTCTPVEEATTIVSLGRKLCVPTVLTGRTMSPVTLLTSRIPWLAAAESSQD